MLAVEQCIGAAVGAENETAGGTEWSLGIRHFDEAVVCVPEADHPRGMDGAARGCWVGLLVFHEASPPLLSLIPCCLSEQVT